MPTLTDKVKPMPTEGAKRFGVGDVLAGLSVAMVAIPQSLAYAELAGMPAYTGLYAVALPAIAAAFFVSSPYLQTGPVAMTSLLTLGVLAEVATPGNADYIALAGLLALVVGVVRILVGLLRLGALAYLLSQPVLMGFTTAAAILILSSQLPTSLGVAPTDREGVMEGALLALLQPAAWQPAAVGLSLISIALIVLGRRLHPLFPGVLVAVIIGIFYSVFVGYGGATVGSVPSGLPGLNLNLPWASLPQLVVGGVVIALVGFAEAASIARTYATQERSKWDANQEFLGQGAANIAAGFFGGFPVGGSFSRSSVNRMAGARTRWSGTITGFIVLAFLPFTYLLSSLPKAILGAIVIAAVLNLIRLPRLLGLWHYSKPQALLAWLTFGLTLWLSPRIDIAVLIGISLAVVVHLVREQVLHIEHDYRDGVLKVEPKGVLWFGSAYRLEEALLALLARYSEVERLEFHLAGLGRIDLSAAMVLNHLLEDAQTAGLQVELCGVPPMARHWVKRLWDPEEADCD